MKRKDVGTLVFLLLLALVVMFAVGYAIRYFIAPVEGALQQREQTVGSGSYRIAQYDHFYSLCGDIQAKEDQIRNTEAREVDNSGGSAGGFTQKQKDAILLAQQNSRAELIRDYNADARKADTAGAFRASDLPYQIDIEGNNTSCNA